MRSQTGVVLIHGAGSGGWIWRDVEKWINAPVLVVEFPERDPASGVNRALALDDYSSHISDQILAWNRPSFILAAHSIGGVVALKLANSFRGRVVGLIGVSASIPSHGGSFLSSLPWLNRFVLGILMKIIGTRPPASAIRNGQCHGLSDEQSEEVIKRFVPESPRLYSDRSERVPTNMMKAYIRLTEDRELSPGLQDFMIRNLNPHEIIPVECGHMCMLQCPEAVAEVINRIIRLTDDQQREQNRPESELSFVNSSLPE